MAVQFIQTMGSGSATATPVPVTNAQLTVAGRLLVSCFAAPGVHNVALSSLIDDNATGGDNVYTINKNQTDGTTATNERAIIASTLSARPVAAATGMAIAYGGAGTGACGGWMEFANVKSATTEATDGVNGSGANVTMTITTVTQGALIVACVMVRTALAAGYSESAGFTQAFGVFDAVATTQMNVAYQIAGAPGVYTYDALLDTGSLEWAVALAAWTPGELRQRTLTGVGL